MQPTSIRHLNWQGVRSQGRGRGGREIRLTELVLKPDFSRKKKKIGWRHAVPALLIVLLRESRGESKLKVDDRCCGLNPTKRVDFDNAQQESESLSLRLTC